ARRRAPGRRGPGGARRPFRRRPERRFARPRRGGARPRGGVEHRHPRGRDGRGQDRWTGRGPGRAEARMVLTPMGERVGVTGIGPGTPGGTGVDEFWAGMTSGRNGIRLITAFETDDLPVKVAGEVPGFDPSPWLDPKGIPPTDRFSPQRVSSAALAWEDAGRPEVPSERAGVIF